MSLTDRFVSFIHETEPSDDARSVMRLSLYDWMACGIGGVAEPVSLIMREQALSDGGAPDARLFGGGDVPARAAALVNGAMSHALDYDDTHFAHVGHPSVAVFPAVMAFAPSDGEAMLNAALIGAEMSVRVGLWLGAGHYAHGFHQTATAGAFGATAAVARLRGLSAEQTAHALGIASTKAAGLRSQFGTMGKPLNAGLAAECGVVACDLAGRGFASNPDAVDGPLGFVETHAGQRDEAALNGLGSKWMMERVSHKLHACCHGLHAMIGALGTVGVDASQVASVEIQTAPRWLNVCNIPHPSTGLETKFSYRHVAAMVVLGRDTARIDSYTDAAAADVDLVPLRQKVTGVGSDAVAETAVRLKVSLEGGGVREATFDLNNASDPEALLEGLRNKGRGLLGDREEALYNATARQVDPDALRDLMG